MEPDRAKLGQFVGQYSVEGRTPQGNPYRGTIRIERKGAFLHAETTLDDAPGVRYGLAMPFADRLVMAFGAKDKVEIGAYRLHDRNVTGMWVPPGATDDDFAQCGREESILEAPGLWKIQKAHAVDQSAYHGSVHLNPADGASFDRPPTPVTMTWKLHDGEYHSFGLAYADAVYSTFNLAQGEAHGIAVYAIEGKTLSGVWLAEGGMTLGSEMLRR